MWKIDSFREVNRERIEFEINTVKGCLSKSRGLDIIAAKAKAKKKLISNDEMTEVLRERQLFLETNELLLTISRIN